MVEINNCSVRGLNHTSVVDVLKEAPVDQPSVFLVQRAQRIEGRKERGGRFTGRSKTPTADMYKSQSSTESQPKKQRSKTPTPRPASSLFGFFRSKTPKPGKENVQESVTMSHSSGKSETWQCISRFNGFWLILADLSVKVISCGTKKRFRA